MNTAFLSLGGNKGDRRALLAAALERIAQRCGTIPAVSGIYETAPWQMSSDKPFLNMAAEVRTELSASQLLDALLGIEHEMGRERSGAGYDDREIDIDLLLFNDEISEHHPQVPHPRMHLRKFVLAPLAEIAPDLIHPVQCRSVSSLLASCGDDSDVKRLG